MNRESDETVISSFEYEYDKAGSRTKVTKPDETLKYTYDNIYQVTEVYSVTAQETLEEFDYDAAGNRTSDSDYDDYTYNDNNQLTSYDNGDVDLYYDDNGNLTKKSVAGTGDTTYTYDQENRLTRIDYPDETYSTYKYDALGRRIEKRDASGNITRFYYDGFDLAAMYNSEGTQTATATFGRGIDNPLSLFVKDDDEIYYYHTDALGSVTEMTDETETTVQSYEYSAFGKILSQSGSLSSTNPFTYTARELDSQSGLYYYRYRYYNADTGRFMSRDPLGYHGGVNLYVYVGDNPIVFVDPYGLFLGERFLLRHGNRIQLIGYGAAGLLLGIVAVPAGLAIAAGATTAAAGLGSVAVISGGMVWGGLGLADLLQAGLYRDVRDPKDQSLFRNNWFPLPGINPLDAISGADAYADEFCP